MYIWYDSRKDDIDIFVEDPFNIYTSPDWKLEWPVFVWKYIIRTIRKSLSDIKNSSLYNKWKFKDCVDKIQAENKLAESDYKDWILSEDYKIPLDENWSAIVKELYILEPVKKKKSKEEMQEEKSENEIELELEDSVSVEEDQLYLQDARVRIITKVWDIIIRDELT